MLNIVQVSNMQQKLSKLWEICRVFLSPWITDPSSGLLGVLPQGLCQSGELEGLSWSLIHSVGWLLHHKQPKCPKIPGFVVSPACNSLCAVLHRDDTHFG